MYNERELRLPFFVVFGRARRAVAVFGRARRAVAVFVRAAGCGAFGVFRGRPCGDVRYWLPCGGSRRSKKRDRPAGPERM